MFTKDECLKALQGLRMLESTENFKKWGQVAPQIKCDVMERLINKHFDEKGNVKVFAKIVFDEDKMKKLVNKAKEQIDEVIEEIINPQPYKFEELKEGMWVWDKSYQEVCYISSIVSRERMYIEYLESHCSIEPYKIMRFEENRFYPVQMANEVKKTKGEK